MTATILRHEFTRTIRPILVILGLAVLVMLLGDLLGLFFGILGVVFAGLVVTLMLPVTQFFLAIDFYRSSYGQGARLTHSLPVTGWRLFWTKTLYALLMSALVGLLSLLLLFAHIIFGLNLVGVDLADAYADVQLFFYYVPGAWPAIILGMAMALFVPIFSMFPSVVIGSGGWARRLGFGGPVIVFVAYYLTTQVLGAASFFIPPVYDFVTADVQMVSLWHNVTNNVDEPVMPLSAVVIQLIVLAILTVWASRDMHSKVELR
ncbi:MAG: hypothetical protein HLX51_06720 [Micrococcaceae bacterium]|nr:hypothetical protein [Micrococcaceae bacterium]